MNLQARNYAAYANTTPIQRSANACFGSKACLPAVCGPNGCADTLIQTYDCPDFELWHCDMYRLERPEDGYELGLEDAFEDAIT